MKELSGTDVAAQVSRGDLVRSHLGVVARFDDEVAVIGWLIAVGNLAKGDLGWVAFDPTHGLCNDENYVRVACGLDYREASPISGARMGGGDEQLAVEVHVNGQSEMQVQN